jgi:hypothetical protein
MKHIPNIRYRFLCHVWLTDGCWFWTGALNRGGYGTFGLKSSRPVKVHTAHRVAWILANGAIPKGQCVLHRCDRRNCVNPGHLFLGTKGDNNRDRDAKGRTAIGEKNGRSILTQVLVAKLRSIYSKGNSYRSIAVRFGIAEGTVYDAIKGRSWSHFTTNQNR